jgi:catechol 2,3-dioxygenase-like lactoylglutathione lyase family enzyme
MRQQKPILVVLAAALIALSRLSSVAQVESSAPSPVRQIDHIMIRTDVPERLYAFFTETLQLPIAWPLAVRGTVASGAVGFGNVNVEVIKFPEQSRSQAQFVGFGFEPTPLAQCIVELKRREITHGEPRPFVITERDGSKKTLFTNVTLRQFSDNDRPANATMHIFLSEYSPTYVDVEQRRARLFTEMRARGGGPLGVVAVQEVIVGALDLKLAMNLWERLLAPGRAVEPGVWRVGNGPAIRVVQARESRLQGIVIRVASLSRAKTFLQEKGLLGSVSEESLTIDPNKLEGLNIQLVER